MFRKGDYDDTELRTVMATLAGVDAAAVCEVAAVLIFHPSPGDHEMIVLADNAEGAEHVARLLRHVAAHVHGGCESCRARNRRRGRHGRG